jgi:hypothetical protein
VARPSRRKKNRKKEEKARSRVSGQIGGIELIEGCARPCWTGPGPLGARLRFAWRLTPDWRLEKAPHAATPHCFAASLPRCHHLTDLGISSAVRTDIVRSFTEVAACNLHLGFSVVGTGMRLTNSDYSLSVSHILTLNFTLFSLTQVTTD